MVKSSSSRSSRRNSGGSRSDVHHNHGAGAGAGASAGGLCRSSSVRWLLGLATAGVSWTAILVLINDRLREREEASSKHAIEAPTPVAPASRVNAQADLQTWHEQVKQLDSTLTGIRQSFEENRKMLGGEAVNVPGLMAAADAVSALRGRPAAVAAAAGEFANRAASRASAEAPSSRTSGGQADWLKQCVFEADVDFVSIGREDVKENVSPEECCRLCALRNLERAGSCAVGVMSALSDTPPLACWLKEKVTVPIRKGGVKACWPPGAKKPPAAAAANQAGSSWFGGNSWIGSQDQSAPGLSEEYRELPPALSSGQVPSTDVLRQRAKAVKDAVKFVWGQYREHAWGMDELRPISGRGANTNFNHAVTMVDSLDTLWIMGLHDEFNEAKDWLQKNLPRKIQSLPSGCSVFETTIRSLGGLLSAYDLSKEKVFLDLSVQLARRILPLVRNDGQVPYTFGGSGGGAGCGSLAESGTIQLEMAYLSHATGDPSFEERVFKFYSSIRSARNLDGLYPNCWKAGRGKITFGANGDSFYEYLLKVWLLKTGQGSAAAAEGASDKDEAGVEYLWDMFDASAEGMERHLVRRGPDGLTYLGNLHWQGGAGGSYEEEMEHLACFAAGWLALGAKRQPKRAADGAKAERRMKLAKSLAYTCYQMYEKQPTGIAPERVKRMRMDLSATDTREYILRPEASEAWFYLHQLTGEPEYREWGWTVFQNMQKWLTVGHGFASLKDVRNTGKQYMDRMESFFIAETLKYLYLLLDPDNQITLDKYVFNTEAHPLSIFR
eukprot:TRINITY_DN55028_c0_g1_i1.p1 TRINITY_DN55028_c0_g1~~TRINITY_DN55028_c0_g1_i1.p1  ORF type:complete len:822 (-),score=151.23 TRINITY_DN55028_c0_g1_i1:271-2616(-)